MGCAHMGWLEAAPAKKLLALLALPIWGGSRPRRPRSCSRCSRAHLGRLEAAPAKKLLALLALAMDHVS